MKTKPLSLFLLFLLVLSFGTGCQGNPVDHQALSLEEIARKEVSDPDSFMIYPVEDLYDLTGIAPEDCAEAVFLADQDTLSGREIIFIRAASEAAAPGIQKTLERYLSQRMEETRNYLPEAYHLQSQARVERKGLVVALAVK